MTPTLGYRINVQGLLIVQRRKKARINKRKVHNKRAQGAKLAKLIIVQDILIIQG